VSLPHFSNNSDSLDLRRSTAQRSVLDARVRDLLLLYARTVLINEGTGDAPTSTATSSRGRQSAVGSTTATAADTAAADTGTGNAAGIQRQPRSSSSGVHSSRVSGATSSRRNAPRASSAGRTAARDEDSYASERFSSERYATLQLQELMADSSDEQHQQQHYSGELSRQRERSAEQHSDDSLDAQPTAAAAAAAAAMQTDEQQSENNSEEDAYESDFNGSEDYEGNDDKAVAKAAAAVNASTSQQRCADSTDAEDWRAESTAVHDSDNTGIADSAADSSDVVAGDSKRNAT
jgi:hypothetical protein